MLICKACAKRAPGNLLRRLPTTKHSLAIPSRAITTSSIRRNDQETAFSELESVAKKEYQNLSHKEKEDKKQKSFEKLKRATRKELQYTKDPYHIAENVSKKLKEGDFEKALLLTQQASVEKQVIVSWNYLIEYQLKNQRLHSAIKIYNEMKKRAQLPNAQTYTIIFQGCAGSQHPRAAVGEAIKIYNSMLTSSRLKPNVTHLNAVLDVCAKAQDIESLFVILRSANGARTPNNLTYTIILNALRHQPSNVIKLSEPEKEQEQAVKSSIDKTISRAKIVWNEVTVRWKKGEIVIDEELMCAMGRILLLGGAKQTDPIINLVTEILGITKLKDGEPALVQDEAQRKEQPKITKTPKQSDRAEPRGPERMESSKSEEESERLDQPEESGQIKKQVPQKEWQRQSTPAVPAKIDRIAGKNTLSLVMRALAQDKRTKLSARLWEYMTTTYGIIPDRNNYRDYLDCLFTGAASGKAARAIASMPSDIIDSRLVRRGLLMCHFDGYNEKAFDNATTIFDIMVRKMRVPDPTCMKLYLQTAVSNYRGFKDTAKYPVQKQGDLAYGQQLFVAIDRVWEPLRLATNHMGFADGPMSSASPEESQKRTFGDRQGMIDVAKKGYAVCDKILSQELIPKASDEYNITVQRRRVLNLCVFRWMGKDQEPGRRTKHVKNEGHQDAFSAAAASF